MIFLPQRSLRFLSIRMFRIKSSQSWVNIKLCALCIFIKPEFAHFTINFHAKLLTHKSEKYVDNAKLIEKKLYVYFCKFLFSFNVMELKCFYKFEFNLNV